MGIPGDHHDQPTLSAREIAGQYGESVSIYDGPDVFQREFAMIPEVARHLFAVVWCDSEICNGGFHQFFNNSTGVLAPEAVEGFRAIGLSECADIVQHAIELLETPYPRERAKRQACLVDLGGRRFFNSLNRKYYDTRERVRFEELLDAHASRHAR